MKCIIAGGRNINNYQHVLDAIAISLFPISEIVNGCASGIDTLAIQWAKVNQKIIKPFPAYWDKYGKKAGPIRNGEMARYAEALIAIWDGKSRGTENMIEQARKYGLKIYIHRVDQFWWVSSPKMTFSVTTVDNIIIDSAPIGRKFIGQHLVRLLKWLKKQGELRVHKYDSK